MRHLMQRFAQFVINKLRRLVTDYTLVPRQPLQDESVAETVSRRSLAWLLEQVAISIMYFPYLNADTANQARSDLDRLVRDLWGGPYYTGNGEVPAT